jgi:hypothetical protein
VGGASGAPVARHARRSAELIARWWFAPSVAILLAAVAALAARYRLSPSVRGVVWAEDGRFFLEQRIGLGFGASILHPYQGYLQFAPRVLTEAALLISPMSRYATTVTALSCLVAGLIAASVFLASRDVVSSLGARICLGLITVLAPTLSYEVLGNMANIHGLFLWLTPWLLLFRPTRWWQSGVVAALVLACELTEIQSVLFVPLAFLSIRHRKTWPVGLALALGTLLQIRATLSSPRDPSPHPLVTAADIVQGFVAHVLVAGSTASDVSAAHWNDSLGLTRSALLFGVPALVALVIVVARSKIRQYPLILALLAGIIVPWVASLLANSGPNFYFSTFLNYANLRHLRYAVVPSLFVFALFVVAGDKLLAWPRMPIRILGGVVLAAVLVVELHSFTAPYTRRTGGPDWATGYAAAVAECEAGATTGTVPTSPLGWSAQLPCAFVTTH